MTHPFRKLALAVTLAVLVSGGDALADRSGGKSVTRPMAGGCETEFMFTSETTIFLAGECHLRHLGLVTVEATQKLTFNFDGTVTIDHDSVYTAANGDRLFATVTASGPFTPPTVAFAGTESYTGGTGRFVSATGGANVVGGAQITGPEGGVGSFAVIGNLTY
jgi:hypothetical protein